LSPTIPFHSPTSVTEEQALCEFCAELAI